MARPIDADAFIKEQCNSCDGYCEKVDCDCLSCNKPYQCAVIQELKNAPTISLDRSKCVELDLEPGDLRNIVELFEDQFFAHLKFLLDEGELDNIEYLRSMLRIYDQLRAAQAEEEA